MVDSKTQRFKKQAKEIHGNRYDYTKSVYLHSMKPLTIICQLHGEFTIRPNNHISQHQGCSRCSKKHKPSTEEFIASANIVHNNKYDYSRVVYPKNNNIKIPITCPFHGIFDMTPSNHLNGKKGCPKCGNLKKGAYHKKTTPQFINEANAIHNNKYNYSRVKYKNNYTKVDIDCPIHGSFWQRPSSHIIQKSGCPDCANDMLVGGYTMARFATDMVLRQKIATMYLIRITDCNEEFMKIGITQKSIDERFKDNTTMPYNFDINMTIKGTLYTLFKLEQQILKEYSELKYKPNKKFDGYTECFSIDSKSILQGYFR